VQICEFVAREWEIFGANSNDNIWPAYGVDRQPGNRDGAACDYRGVSDIGSARAVVPHDLFSGPGCIQHPSGQVQRAFRLSKCDLPVQLAALRFLYSLLLFKELLRVLRCSLSMWGSSSRINRVQADVDKKNRTLCENLTIHLISNDCDDVHEHCDTSAMRLHSNLSVENNLPNLRSFWSYLNRNHDSIHKPAKAKEQQKSGHFWVPHASFGRVQLRCLFHSANLQTVDPIRSSVRSIGSYPDLFLFHRKESRGSRAAPVPAQKPGFGLRRRERSHLLLYDGALVHVPVDN